MMVYKPTVQELHQTVEQMGEDIEECRTNIHDRLDQGATQMNQMHVEVCANTDAMEEVTRGLAKFNAIWDAGEGFVRVVKWFFKAGAFVMKIVLLLTAIAALIAGALHLGGAHK